MVQRFDFYLGLHRLAATTDGGGSGDYVCVYVRARACVSSFQAARYRYVRTQKALKVCCAYFIYHTFAQPDRADSVHHIYTRGSVIANM